MTKPTTSAGNDLEQVFFRLFQGASDERILELKRGIAPWDSLKHIELLTALEAEFNVQFSFADAVAANSFDEIKVILDRLLRL